MSKRVINLLAILAMGIACASQLDAKQRHITFNETGGNVTAVLRSRLAGLTRADTVFITFGEGDYYINGSVNILPNSVISGAGKERTRILFSNDGSFQGDYLINFDGKKGQSISVEISDLSLNMVPHDTLWLKANTPKYILKFINVDGVKIHDFNSTLFNAHTTTMDFRVAHNVMIDHCELVNHNNSDGGGIIWLRRDNRNVTITNNKLVKYGDDEMLAIWEGGDDTSVMCPESGLKENITFANNEVRFVKCSGAQDMICSVQLALYNFGTDKGTHIHWRNIAIRDNTFYYDSPIRTWLSIRFNQTDTHENVSVTGNTVTYTGAAGFEGNSHSDIEVHDAGATANEAVEIAGNTFHSAMLVKDKYGGNGHYHLIIDGATVNYHDNSLDAATATINQKNYGPTLSWIFGKGGDLRLTDNTLDGIVKIGKLDGGGDIRQVRITARDNMFAGDTRIFCRGVIRADLDFRKNVFNSTSYEVLLQEFAKVGTLTFKDNTVNVSHPYGGVLFAHYDKSADIRSMRFERLEVGGNRLRGVSSRQWLPDGMNTDSKKLTRDYYE